MKNSKMWLDIAEEQAKLDTTLQNLVKKFGNYKNVDVTKIIVDNEILSKKIGKDRGVYYTIVATGSLSLDYDEIKSALKKVIVDIVAKTQIKPNVLVVGLGNRNVDVDALGTITSENINIKHKNLHSIMAGVYGMTGIESVNIINGIAKEISANLVIAIDTLATTKVSRIYHSFQVTNAGLVPGSATGFSHDKICRESIGIPVIAIGVPTCIYARSLIYDALLKNGVEKHGILNNYAIDILGEENMGMLLMTKDVKNEIKVCGRIIGDAINECF